MRNNSLPLRLFFSAAAWTVVTLVVTGIVLSSLYRGAVERAFDRRLGVYLHTIVADVATRTKPATAPTIIRRAFVRIASVGLVLAGDAPRSRQDRRALVALAVDSTLPHLEDRAVTPSASGTRQD